MKKTILVVDDEKDIRVLIEKILLDERYTVLTAENGEQMLSLLSTTRPDLILMDVMMPGISGYELVEQLKQNAETRDIPIVMLSVLNASRDIQRAMDLGASAFLNKPFDPPELSQKIKLLLQAHP